MGKGQPDPEGDLRQRNVPIRILYVTIENLDLFKGSTVHIKESVRALRELGCEVTLVASGDPNAGCLASFISFGKITHHEGRIRRAISLLWGLIQLFFLVSRYVRLHDVVYARDFHVALVCTLPKLLFSKHLVYEMNGLSSAEWLMREASRIHQLVARMIERCERLASCHADRIVVVTDGLRHCLVSKFGVDGRRVSVIPNGVDTRAFHPINEAESLDVLREHLGIGRNDPVVLFTGNLAPWQGIDTLLSSVPVVLKRVPQVRFLIVGGGILQRRLLAKVKRMNLEGSVLLGGMVPYAEVPRYVNLADVCVSPKRDYPTGLSPLKVYEYMACGKPVVSSRVAGLGFIEEKMTGLLVEPENPEALARGIIALLLDPQKREYMGRNGAELARQEFDWEKRARQVLQVIEADTQRSS